jgi:demethylmenaquinone methyltransferase / 2-methoxy-6-polyprenyl-1,4-benzoquinol methylase
LKLPFHDMAFDAVVCGFGVRNLDSVEKGLKEIARVLKPGGKAVILEFFKPLSPLNLLIYHLYVKYIVPLRGGMISKDKTAYDYLQQTAGKFMPAEEFKKLMADCGFKDITSENRTMGIAVSVMGVRK